MHQYVIVAFREGEPDHHCALTSDSCIIGRASDADLVLPDSAISRQHAIVRVDDGQVVVEDYKSTNGVFVNGEHVERSVFQEGDFLTVGPYTVVMRVRGEPEDDTVPTGETAHLGFDAARKLHEEFLEKHSSEYFTVLYKTVLLLSDRSRLDQVLRQVLSLVMESLPAQRGAIVVKTDELHGPEIAASYSVDGQSEEQPISRTLRDHVLETRTALLTKDAKNDPRFAGSDSVIRDGIGAAMCAPLCGSGRAVGVIYADTCEDTSCFDTKELEFFSVVGHVIGMAIENRLLDEAMVRQERLAALGKAIAGIGHDVKSIITGIKGGVELLELAIQKPDTTSVTKVQRMMHKSVGRLESYLVDLLTFVKETKLCRSETCIGDIARDVLEVMRPRAERQRVHLVLEGDAAASADIDGPQIHRVLLNLVQNAVNACEGGGGFVTVSLDSGVAGLIIRVSDTGVGIAPEHLPRLSEPFFTTKGNGGTGLGLAISYRIVEQHGGRITVTSKLDRGSTFTVFIPSSVTAEMQSRPDSDLKKTN